MTIESIKQDEYFSDVVIRLITESRLGESFKNYFKRTFPFLANSTEEASLNPNDTAANDIKRFINDNKQIVAQCIIDFEQETKIEIEPFIKNFRKLETIRFDLKGRVLKTTTQKWSNFAYEIRNAHYKDFSIIKEDENIYVFFT